MKPMEYKGYIGSIEIDFNSNSIHGRLLFIKDVVTYESASVAELQDKFKQAVDEYLAVCEELGDTPDTPCKGSLNIRLGPETHKNCAIAAIQQEISLNDWIKGACEEKLRTEQNSVPQRQTEKISLDVLNTIEEDFQFGSSESNGAGNVWNSVKMH